MRSQSQTYASPKWVRFAVLLGPIGVPLLIAFECNLQSMILFEGFFLAAFLLPAAFVLRRFLASQLGFAPAHVYSWSKASVFGTITALLLTLFYAFTAGGSFAQTQAPEAPANAAQYLTVAIGFPLVLGAFQAVAVGAHFRWPALWPIVPALGCTVSYGASQLIEKLEVIDRSGLFTLVLTLVAAFFITFWIEKTALRLLRPKLA